MISRRSAFKHGLRFGLAAATAPLWNSMTAIRAFAQVSDSAYKAVVVITMVGGNDSNNLLIPLDTAEYREYSVLRSALALPAAAAIPLAGNNGGPAYGFHPSLPNVAALYSQGRAAVVANIGPLGQPTTKRQLALDTTLYPQALLSHPVGQQQWESATTVELPPTGWGGRIADLIYRESGSLPPVLNTSVNSIFTTGRSVQGIAVQSGGPYPALPPGMNAAILEIAEHESFAMNKLVSQTAKFRATAMQQQATLNQAMNHGAIKQSFTNTQLGSSLRAITQLLAGRSVIGANRQLFYAQQPLFDTHHNQLAIQAQLLSEFDANMGSFFAALDDLGLTNDVIVCTHSDFSRTLTSNTTGGSDHAWGSHQLILGGGIKGGRIIGKLPVLELGGADDMGDQGIWIPTLSVAQMTGAIGKWLGLDSVQLAQVFPDLDRFPMGAIVL